MLSRMSETKVPEKLNEKHRQIKIIGESVHYVSFQISCFYRFISLLWDICGECGDTSKLTHLECGDTSELYPL